MNLLKIAGRILGLALLGAMLAGCSTTKQTESQLAAAGFKIIPASTPQQQQQLNSLPSGKVSIVKRQGQVYFVYPDRSQNVLYVGKNRQYDAYQNMLLNDQAVKASMQAANQEESAAVLTSETNLLTDDPWGVYGAWIVE